MKRYPAYKYSGVEWIGNIPQEWETAKLNLISEKVTDGSHFSPEIQEDGYPYITVRDIRDSGIDFDNCKKISKDDFIALSKNGCKPNENDILLTKDGTIGKAVVVGSNNSFVVLSSLGLITPDKNKMNSEFLRYYLISPKNVDQMQSFIHGAALTRLTIKTIKELIALKPPLHDQYLIANYLDHKTNLIDTLIEKKQKQIEMLQEQRAAIIHRAATKGLNPNVEMKDSGIDWIGDVPTHWKVSSTKYVAIQKTGHTPSRQHPEYWENCTIPWFTLADVWQLRDGRNEYVNETKEKISKIGLDNSSAELLPAGTVIVSRTASVGFSGIMAVPMATTQDYINWVCGPNIIPEYLLYVFRSMKQEFSRLTMGSTHKTIYVPDARSFKTPVPPIEEQNQIVDYIKTKKSKSELIEDNLKSTLDYLLEYRTTLISDVVTGKIDVRDEAIP